METLRRSERPFYGWVLVGLAFCSLAFWFGMRTGFSVFYAALDTAFSRGPAALAISCLLLWKAAPRRKS